MLLNINKIETAGTVFQTKSSIKNKQKLRNVQC